MSSPQLDSASSEQRDYLQRSNSSSRLTKHILSENNAHVSKLSDSSQVENEPSISGVWPTRKTYPPLQDNPYLLAYVDSLYHSETLSARRSLPDREDQRSVHTPANHDAHAATHKISSEGSSEATPVCSGCQQPIIGTRYPEAGLCGKYENLMHPDCRRHSTCYSCLSEWWKTQLFSGVPAPTCMLCRRSFSVDQAPDYAALLAIFERHQQEQIQALENEQAQEVYWILREYITLIMETRLEKTRHRANAGFLQIAVDKIASAYILPTPNVRHMQEAIDSFQSGTSGETELIALEIWLEDLQTPL